MPYYESDAVTLYNGDCRTVLATLPAQSVHCCVTSPPYWGLRNYGLEPSQWADGWRGCLGLEPDMGAYVRHLVEVFRGVWRVLRDDGTCFINLGDSYTSGGRTSHGTRIDVKQSSHRGMNGTHDPARAPQPPDLKEKNLTGMPWRVAFALQADGWILRSDIIWHKPNPMPESVTDRPTKSHEYLFLLTKQPRYFYDQEAVREPHTMRPQARPGGHKRHQPGALLPAHTWSGTARDLPGVDGNPAGRNKRTVWTIATQAFRGAHFAVMPERLVEPCVLAGTSAHGCCSACGAPYRRVVERTGYDGAGRADDSVYTGQAYRHPQSAPRGPRRNFGEPTAHTTGWQPGCACAAPVAPCTALDPFGGSGTVGVVAARHGRQSVLIEQNAQYCQLAVQRLAPREERACAD